MTSEERDAVRQLALGRIFRLLSRPYEPGDERLYADARAALLATAEVLPSEPEPVASVLMRHRARFGD